MRKPKHFEPSSWTNEKTKYKNVFKRVKKNDPTTVLYETRIYVPGYNNPAKGVYDGLREAAKALDLYLIGQGKEPINVLKRKI